MRIDPDIKQQGEDICARQRLAFIGIVIILIQQLSDTSFKASPENEAYVKDKAMHRLTAWIQCG